MQIARKSLGAIVLWACLLVALTCGSQVAFAAGLPADGANSLTASVNKSFNEEKYNTDVTKANVVVDVYKIASAKKNANGTAYEYTLVQPFGSDVIPVDKLTESAMKDMAVQAAKAVTSTTSKTTVAADGKTKLSLPDDGIYLLLTHGKDISLKYGSSITDSLTAKGDKYQYYFLPFCVFAPTTESAGVWTRDIVVNIKPGKNPETKPTEPTPTPDTKKTVNTGDTTELFPYYCIMIVSGLLLLAIAVSTIRRKRATQSSNTNKSS